MGAHNSVVGADQGFRAPSGDQESVRDSVHEDSASARIAAGQRPRQSFRHPQDSRPYEQGVALARLRPSQRRGGPPNPAAPFWEYLFAEVRELCEGASNKTRPLRRDQRLISERDANHTIYGGGLALIGNVPNQTLGHHR